MTRVRLLLLVFLGACGGSSVATTPPPTSVPATGAEVSEAAQEPASVPLAWLVPQVLGGAEEPYVRFGDVVVTELSGDRFFVATRTSAVITDDRLRGIARAIVPRAAVGIVSALDDGRILVTSAGAYELATGRLVEGGYVGSYVGADADGRRLVRVVAERELLTFAVDDVATRGELSRVTLSLAAMRDALGPGSEPAREEERQPELVFDVEVPVRATTLVGDTLTVTIEARAICTFDLARSALERCVRTSWDAGPTDPSPAERTFAGGRVVGIEERGLALAAGSDAVIALRFPGFVTVASRGAGFELVTERGGRLVLGADAAASEVPAIVAASEPAVESSAPVDDPESALVARIARTARWSRSALVAVAPATAPGVAVAVADRGRVRVLDGLGRDVVPPVRLPSEVTRSGCYSFEFATDVDLVLHGPRPCLPTRIRFREARTEPLGPAVVVVERSADGARSVMLANRRILVLDGRTGATLAEFDPRVEHARSIELLPDGVRGVVHGTEGSASFRLGDPSPEPSGLLAATVRPFVAEDGVGPRFDRHDGIVVSCRRDGSLVVADAFSDASRTVASRACADAAAAGFQQPDLVFVRGFVAVRYDARITLVRLSDGRPLELTTFASATEIAAAVVDGDRVLGIEPAGSTLVVVRDPATRALVDRPVPRDAFDAIVTAFLAGR